MQFKAVLIAFVALANAYLASAEVAGRLTMDRIDAFSEVFPGNVAPVAFTLSFDESVTIDKTNYHNVHFVNYATPYLTMPEGNDAKKSVSCYFTNPSVDSFEGTIVKDTADAGKYSYTLYHPFQTDRVKSEDDGSYSYSFACKLEFADNVSSAPAPTEDWSCVMPSMGDHHHMDHSIKVASFTSLPITAIDYSSSSLSVSKAIAPVFIGNTMAGMTPDYIATTAALSFEIKTAGLESNAVLTYKPNQLYTAEVDFACTYGTPSTPMSARLEGTSAETCAFVFELHNVAFTKDDENGKVTITCSGFTSPATKVTVAPAVSAFIGLNGMVPAECKDCTYTVNYMDVQLAISTDALDTDALLSITVTAKTLEPEDDHHHIAHHEAQDLTVHFVDYVDNIYLGEVKGCSYDGQALTHTVTTHGNEQMLSTSFVPSMMGTSKSYTVLCNVVVKAHKPVDAKSNWSCIMPSGGEHAHHTYMNTKVVSPSVTVSDAKKAVLLSYTITGADAPVREGTITSLFKKVQATIIDEAKTLSMVSTKVQVYVKSNTITVTGLTYTSVLTLAVVPEQPQDMPQLAYLLAQTKMMKTIADAALVPAMDGSAVTITPTSSSVYVVADACFDAPCGSACFACGKGASCVSDEDCQYYCHDGKCTSSNSAVAYSFAMVGVVVMAVMAVLAF